MGSKTIYAVQALTRTIEVSGGVEVKLSSERMGCLGMLPVFDTEQAARDACGPDAKLIELIVDPDKI